MTPPHPKQTYSRFVHRNCPTCGEPEGLGIVERTGYDPGRRAWWLEQRGGCSNPLCRLFSADDRVLLAACHTTKPEWVRL